MPSPFPGMNPFLEQSDAWEDFHQDFMTRARESLSAQVGPSYMVKLEVRLYLHELSAEERRYFGRADVGVTAPSMERAGAAVAGGPAPVRLTLPAVDIQRHSSLEIRDRRDRRVVTAIELLSPSNKDLGPDYDAYSGKRRGVLASRTHLVEIDLRRGGKRPRPPDLPDCDYYVLVSRYAQRPNLDFWPIGLRERLPVVPVPLVPPDGDVYLDLQALLDRAYDAADYGKYIYVESPEPPLTPAHAEWARQFVPGAG
ncbi:MAG TPA: DUF4058 family protein [Pirellulales bacterium]|nr:DUF4058 family protein [Pirellulales bacterium]